MDLLPEDEIVDKKPVLAADGSIQIVPTTTTSLNLQNNTSEDIKPAITNLLTVADLNIEILPVIYDIIRCVETDPIDNPGKQRETHECSQKILELEKRFESAREQIRRLPGIEYNKEDQLQILKQLYEQIKSKQQLIRKYKNSEL